MPTHPGPTLVPGANALCLVGVPVLLLLSKGAIGRLDVALTELTILDGRNRSA